jgi:hypothetical protein
VRDPSVRSALLTTSLSRMRKETPDEFLILISEWMHPARQGLWPNGIQALLPLITDPEYENLPPIFALARPVIESAPGMLQTDLANLINALYQASPSETEFFLREIIEESKNQLTVITLRRILDLFHPELQSRLRNLVRQKRVAP